MKKNYRLENFTTLRIGGPASYFFVAQSEAELLWGLDFAERHKLPWYVVGEGSNLVVSDQGYKGVIIQNRIAKFERAGRLVTVGAGSNLWKFIFRLNSLDLSGLERMAGIPGTVGGAIYGCAGAYGQEIKDHLVNVRFFDGQRLRIFSLKQCQFGYRESIFKRHKSWIITEATFRLGAGERGELARTSRAIIKLRQKKYPPGLRCPGSFFKNIKLAELRPASLRKTFLKKVSPDKIMYGKAPAGYLLEEVSAKGMRQGTIRVALHHANLIYNPGQGTAQDVKKLAAKLKGLVKKKFGLTIEEEVQYL